MDLESMPKYPQQTRRAPAEPREPPTPLLRSFEVRLLLGLAVLAGCLFAAHWLSRVMDVVRPPVPPVLSFSEVRERYWNVRTYMSRDEVYELLGRPTVEDAWEPELAKPTVYLEAKVVHGHEPRQWVKWEDTHDKNQWVAAFIARDRVPYVLRKGF